MAEPRDPDRERYHERERAGDYGSEPVGGERYVAGGPETTHSPERRETGRPVRTKGESYTPAETEYRGVRYGSTSPYAVELRDMVRWGPIFAGFAAAMATLIIMGVLGGAIGATTLNQGPDAAASNAGTFGVIWAAVTVILAFFVGGWLAARTAGIGGQMTALVNSGLVWAFTLMVVLFVAGIGLAGLADTLTSVTGLNVSAADPAAEETMVATWGTFAALVIGLASALVGGLVGMHKEPEPLNR